MDPGDFRLEGALVRSNVDRPEGAASPEATSVIRRSMLEHAGCMLQPHHRRCADLGCRAQRAKFHRDGSEVDINRGIPLLSEANSRVVQNPPLITGL